MDIVAEVRRLGLTAGEYAVVGSGPLAIRGIRPAHDIDLIVSAAVYADLKQRGWHEEHFAQTSRPWVLFDGPFDVSTSWSVKDYKPTLRHLLDTADIIGGVPFVRLEEVLLWKKTCGRLKDLQDVALIENYLRA